jgi:hypothetical protein
MLSKLVNDIAHFRHHFNAMYMTAIPRPPDEAESFLAFICILSTIDTLAGLSAPTDGTGQRSKRSVTQFFHPGLARAVTSSRDSAISYSMPLTPVPLL